MPSQYDLQNQELIARVRAEEMAKGALSRQQTGMQGGRFGLPQPVGPQIAGPSGMVNALPQFGGMSPDEALALLTQQLQSFRQGTEPALAKISQASVALIPPKARKVKKVTPKGQEKPATNTPVASIDNASPYAKSAGKPKFDFMQGMSLVGTTPETGGAPLLPSAPVPEMVMPAGVSGMPMQPMAKKTNPILRALTLGLKR